MTNTKTETLSSAAETLAQRVLIDTAEQRQLHPERRPTWAPPLPFQPELVSALERLKSLLPDADFDPSYGRLWAEWADPKRCDGRFDGFTLRAGKAHNGERLVRLRPGARGLWHVGPHWLAPKAPKAPRNPVRVLMSLDSDPDWIAQPEKAREFRRDIEEHFAKAQEKFAQEQEQHAIAMERVDLRDAIRDPGVAAFLNFAGAPDATMKSGAILAGICMHCGRVLTDTTSRELGIGPECRRPFSAPVLKAWHQKLTLEKQAVRA
jgi:hypothetical protein